MLKDIIDNKRFRARAVVGFWPAQSVGDDIEIYTDLTKKTVLQTVHFLRQQKEKLPSAEHPVVSYECCDYICPREVSAAPITSVDLSYRPGAKSNTWIVAKNDDYSAIMVKAIGDRFAEATAEYVHKRMREDWGFVENLTNEELISEKYRGVRPAPGYPACPDHTEVALLWKLLEAEANTGTTLTENFAMNPPSSVSGFYFGHPEARYFQVGNIAKDQVEDYAERKNMSLATVEKWLSPNLDYEPA